MYSILFLIVIAGMVVYGILFVRYHEVIAYYGEEPIGFHRWVKKFFADLWLKNKL